MKAAGLVAAGAFSQGNLRLPGYGDICNESHAYIIAAATTKVGDEPWQASSEVLAKLAVDVLSEFEDKLTATSYWAAQAIHDWFQTQRITLVFLGVKIAWAAKELWEPGPAAGLQVELAMKAIERVMSALIKENPGDATAIHEWYSEYDRLVYVLGVSITTALSFAGELGPTANPTGVDVDGDADDSSSEDDDSDEAESAVDQDEIYEGERDEADADNNADDAGDDEDTEDRYDSGEDESDDAEDGEQEDENEHEDGEEEQQHSLEGEDDEDESLADHSNDEDDGDEDEQDDDEQDADEEQDKEQDDDDPGLKIDLSGAQPALHCPSRRAGRH